MQTETLSEMDDGSTVVVYVGDIIQVELPENPSTGYRWETTVESLARPLDCEEPEYVKNPDKSIGGSGRRRQIVRALAAGRGDLCYRLRRPWAAPGEVVAQIRFHVIVEDPR